MRTYTVTLKNRDARGLPVNRLFNVFKNWLTEEFISLKLKAK